MSVKITPAPGRVMWYYPAYGEPYADDAPLAAQVAKVLEDGARVNVSVLNPGGVPFPAQNVPVVQEGEAPEEGVAFVTWMPYQIGQAKAAVTPAPITDLAGNVLDIKPGVNQPSSQQMTGDQPAADFKPVGETAMTSQAPAADPNAANGPS
jgi:hypothetical protein